ncbi:MAG: cupin domain-containing protein [Methanobacterium sp.]|jgi:transcriptional regulator with XRE-family HTH domain|nr:cupin domain-containing protein [Methanobacterium sp.]
MSEDNKIGAKIRQVRESKEMSAKELAEASGNSEELIESLEEGAFIPSMTPLFKIARALGVRLGTFLDDMPQTGPFVVKSGQSEEIIHFTGSISNLEESTLDLYSLAYGKGDRHMEPFIVDLHPKDIDKYELSTHEGEEFIYVMEGQIELLYGQENYVLSTGDSIYYDSVIPHELHAHQKEAKILAVIYAPL